MIAVLIAGAVAMALSLFGTRALISFLTQLGKASRFLVLMTMVLSIT